MKLVVDIDGVIADWNAAFARKLSVHEPKTLVPPLLHGLDTRLDCWHWYKRMGYRMASVDRAWREIEMSKDFWLTLAPYAQTMPDLHNLAAAMRKGHEVYFVTARTLGVAVKQQTERWLREHLPWDRHLVPTVVLTSAKAEFAYTIGANAIIDDYPENLYNMPSTCRVFLLDRPWNHDAVLDATRVASVTTMLSHLGVLDAY